MQTFAVAQAEQASKTWQYIQGQAADLAIGQDGTVAAVDQQGRAYKFDPAKQGWQSIGKSISRVAVDQRGEVWGVDKNGTLRKFSGTSWTAFGSGAEDLAIGADGTIYVATNTGTIARFDPKISKWTPESGTAKKLAQDAQGNLWRISEGGNIARKLDDAWIGVAGKAQDIAADKAGRVFITGQDNRLYQWKEETASWMTIQDVRAQMVAVNETQIWRVDQAGKIYAQGLSTTVAQEGISKGERGDGAIDPNTIPDTSEIVFEQIPDDTKLEELSIGADGSIFGLTSSGEIRRWSNAEERFNEFPGQVDRLVVQKNGLPLAIGTQGNLVEHDGKAWRLVNLNLDLVDLDVFDDENVVVINNREQSAKLSETLTSFSLLSQRGQKIAAQKNGAFWVIDSSNRLFACDPQGACERQSVNAEDISIGPAGSVFIVDTSANLRRFNDSDTSFEIIRQGNTARVAVGPRDRPWILDSNGNVLQSGFFERDESGDRRLALKTEATEDVTRTANNTNTGVQITQSISFTSVSIPTSANGVNLGSGIFDLTSGADDIVIATGFDDDPCVDGSGRNWVYNSVSRSFGELDYLQRVNLFVGLALDELIRSTEANGDTPPSTPAPAISSLFLEWNRSCGNTSELLTYVSSVFNDPTNVSTQTYNAATLALPLDDDQIPDLDIAADGTVINLTPGNEIEMFKPENYDTVTRKFDDLEFQRIGLGKDADDFWAVSLTNNVYEYIPSNESFELRSHNADDKAQDIGVGHDGSVFIVNMSGTLKKWDAVSKRFVKTNKSGVKRVAVDSRGNPIVANFPESQTVFFGR